MWETAFWIMGIVCASLIAHVATRMCIFEEFKLLDSISKESLEHKMNIRFNEVLEKVQKINK